MANFRLCLPQTRGAKVFKLFKVIACVGEIFVGFLECFQLFLEIVAFDLESDVIFFHSVQDVFIAIQAEQSVYFF